MACNIMRSVVVILMFALTNTAQERNSEIERVHMGFSDQAGSPKILKDFSQRATLVLFLARLKAGDYGAKTVDVDHLLEALIVEDQEGARITKPLRVDSSADQARPKPFFAPEFASQLLTKIRKNTSQRPIPTSQDLPMAPDLVHALSVATDFRRKLQAESVQPLHLLAAGLGELSSRVAGILVSAGITQEKVLEAIRESK